MKRRHVTALLAATALPGITLAQGGPVEGQQYVEIKPPVATPPGKIEVLEFFSYACPHCSAFEPVLEAWAKKLPSDVVLKRMPVPFLMNAELFQRTYFALESLNMVDAMQKKIFAAVHVERARLDKPEDIAALITKNGGDGARYLEAMKSFGVANGVTRAKKAMADYKVESVPTLAVAGRYITSPSQAGGAEQALRVVDFLIQKSRKA